MAADVTVAPTLGHAILMTQGGVGATPGYDAIDLRRMIQAAGGGQEGAYDSTGWKVREHTSGANMQVQVDANVGLARVDGESVTHQGPYVVAPHSAVITLDVTTAHSTNPRIDMVILQVRDNTHDALGANDARVRILAGTATSGATLDNLNGQQSLPSNAIRLADVLVPAADTTISNAQIRDRRKRAHGAFFTQIRTVTNLTTTSLSQVAISDTSFQARIECSGAPLRITLTATGFNVSATGSIATGMFMDAASLTPGDLMSMVSQTASNQGNVSFVHTFIPAAGSHLFIPSFRAITGGTATFFIGGGGGPLELIIEEDTRVSANNGTA